MGYTQLPGVLPRKQFDGNATYVADRQIFGPYGEKSQRSKHVLNYIKILND